MAGGRHKTGHYTGCFVGRNADAPTLLIVMTGLRDFFLLDFQLKSHLIVMTGLLDFFLLDFQLKSQLIVMTGIPDFWTSGLLDFRTSKHLLFCGNVCGNVAVMFGGILPRLTILLSMRNTAAVIAVMSFPRRSG